MPSQHTARCHSSPIGSQRWTFDHRRAYAQVSSYQSRMDARPFSQLGHRDWALHARPGAAPTREQASSGDGVSFLSWLTDARETIRQRASGDGLPTRAHPRLAHAPECPLDSGERTRLSTVAGTGDGFTAAGPRKHSRFAVLPLTLSESLTKGERTVLNQPTLDLLRSMKLKGMADAYTQQLEQPDLQRLSFEERLAMLVDREIIYRESRRQR